MWWTNPINYYGNFVESIHEEKPASDYIERIAGVERVTFADITIVFSTAIDAPFCKEIYDVTGQQAWEYLGKYTQDTIERSLGDIEVKAVIKEKKGLYLIGLSTRNIPDTKVDFLQIRVSEQQTFIERAKMDLGTLVNAMLRR